MGEIGTVPKLLLDIYIYSLPRRTAFIDINND